MNRFDQLADLQDRLTLAQVHGMDAFLLGYLANQVSDEQWTQALAAAHQFVRADGQLAGRTSVTA